MLNALLVWQYLNAVAAPTDERFTRNFLIVAPGLIVYDRLLDSFQGKQQPDGARDFGTSDISAHAELFIPDDQRDRALAFVQGSVVTKREIGRKVTGSGVIALTNWHVLTGQDPDVPDFIEDEILAPGEEVDDRAAAASFISLSPGLNAGNSLDVLDRRFARGEAMAWLTDLPSLLVFNDEAHHVHPVKRGEAGDEVEWQRSLNELSADKGRRFVQIDFSATPYNELRGKKVWFPHIVVDFPLIDAMSAGLVKSLVLDKRQEVAALKNEDLDFSAERDERGAVIGLSSGQRVMINAGLAKLRILEEQFEKQDPDKNPKLLIMVEDTKVSPWVQEFLLSGGMAADDVLLIDSKQRADIRRDEWEQVRTRLFGIDSLRRPKVIISVLMLREGFDVNNICVIVPLRAAGSGILAEQTVGRGLRLMWRGEPEIEAAAAENRALIRSHKPPRNYFEVLFVVEHPRFEDLYREQLGDDLVGAEETDSPTPVGDVERVELRDGYEEYDFRIPFVLHDAEEELEQTRMRVDDLPTSTIPLADLLGFAGRHDTFVSQDVSTRTQFGPFTVEGAKLTAAGYNDYLGKLANRVGGAFHRTFTAAGALRQNPSSDLVLQVNRPQLLSAADRYIRGRFFGVAFEPLDDEQWRVLMIDAISDQIAGNLATALVGTLGTRLVGEPEVRYRSISEVRSLPVRESFGVAVEKCVYPRLPVPARNGGLERLFIEWADADAAVEALVKIHEYKHEFLRRPYLKADGMPAQYSPDFLVRTADAVYVVETKAQSSISDANVQRKKQAATGWCEQINELPDGLRDGREWHYVLLGESPIKEWHGRGMPASRLLDFARLRPAATMTHSTLPGLESL